MSYNPQRISNISCRGVKVALFGHAGAGKTYQISTLSRPFIVSTEKGLMTLLRLPECQDFQYGEVKQISDIDDILKWLKQNPNEYDCIVIDSVSELAEISLRERKKVRTDQRKAYGEMADDVTEKILNFLDIEDKDIVMIFQVGRIEDSNTGSVMYSLAVPSQSFAQKVPYRFDETLALRTANIKDDQGNPYIDRWLQCQNDGLWNCKDRSGYLEMEMQADLGRILRIIHGRGVDPEEKTTGENYGESDTDY